MEALAGASSVVAIVGLAGQVVQGCSSLSIIFSDMKGAPQDLRLLVCELEIIQQIGGALRDENFRDTTTPTGWDPTPALEFCMEAIAKVQKFVAAYGAPNGADDHMKWRKRVLIGMSREKIRKHPARLERAKTHLAASKSTRLLSKQKKVLDLTNEIRDSVKSIERFQKDNAAIAAANSDSIHNLKESVSRSLGATQDLNQSITKGIEKFPEQMSQVVEHTVRKILEQHLARMSDELRKAKLE